ncbi:YdeI/OmpD-associated family protein [Sphingobacterium suaedae]|uniref:YdeI family protein n=1 Tax=Sphingobacterium suaedae TaxID=1686402 RepID=A0ABW5KHC7_9SPHI
MESKTNSNVDHFFDRITRWKVEMMWLREILLRFPELTEDYKWMHPCYTVGGKNVVLIHGFKEYCALLFHKGALLDDPNHILIQQTANVQAARQIRFTTIHDIKRQQPVIEEYIRRAIEIEVSGKKVVRKQTSDFQVPDEFQTYLDEDELLRVAFQSLTPGRQRGYLFYFAQAKQSKTRISRIEKYISKIRAGKGLDD